eukprot:8735-Pelagococcus_subviridis.AAC.2
MRLNAVAAELGRSASGVARPRPDARDGAAGDVRADGLPDAVRLGVRRQAGASPRARLGLPRPRCYASFLALGAILAFARLPPSRALPPSIIP